MRLTDVAVRNMRPKGERYVVWESRGFGIRVGSSGRKTWIASIRLDGRKRWLVLGTYPALSLADARIKHAHVVGDIESGRDPRVALRYGPEGLTIAALARQYVRLYARPQKRSWKQDSRLLRREVLPEVGQRKAKTMTRREVIGLLDRIVARGAPVTACRTLAVVRRLYSWAVAREIVLMSPCIGIPRPAKEVPRERILSPDELRKLWRALSAAPAWDRLSGILRCVLQTAQRPGEVASLSWDSIDTVGLMWTIPRTKAGHSHLVPLSVLALATVKASRESFGEETPWGFPSERGGCYSRVALARRMRQHCAALALERATPHDLRRTAATRIAALGTPRLVVSRILGHADQSITSIYDRHTYEPEMRAALESWAALLEGLK